MRIFLLITFLFFEIVAYCQTQFATKKTLQAVRTDQKITIDADLNEPAWASALAASDFVVRWPKPGLPASKNTVVKVLYTNNALYIGAICYDSSPDSIFHRLSKRDELENTDAFSVIIDAYQDGQNALEFGVTPENIQFDSKYSISNANGDNGNYDGEDPGWDAVWFSAAAIKDNGWVIEMELPYAALRFPKSKMQHWNINFNRTIRRFNESDSWNEVKAEINGSLNQMGHLEGIENIKSPIRLSATPFVAGYANNVYNLPTTPHSGWAYPYAYGMDIKYGINDAFTLDATVIPDFGQVRTDNFVLNLSPFEVRFNENRPFFTEGTELFNKGGLFYSRRVGEGGARLLNASKLSGRTSNGLGIGLFNAVEAADFETVEIEGVKTETTLRSLTNKNILVFDQNLKNNSSITLINTNVTRAGHWTDANVTGFLFNLKNKSQSYATSGRAVMSHRFKENGLTSGFSSTVDVSKTSGNWQWGASAVVESDEYNPNDLGFLYSPNEISNVGWISYNRYTPWWKLNNCWASTWAYNGLLYKPFGAWTETSFGLNFGGNTKHFHNFGFNGNISPMGERDYFEPRTNDFNNFYHIPMSGNMNIWYNSDNRKKMTYYLYANHRMFNEHKRQSTNVNTGFRWRANNKLTLGIGIGKSYSPNNVGGLYESQIVKEVAGYDAKNKIWMGRRNINGYNNDINVNFAFNNRMNLALFSRHYWQKVDYLKFYTLNNNGDLQPISYTGQTADGNPVHNVTANYFNIDLVYTWRFAPGSDIVVVYKNFIGDNAFGLDANHNYGYNVARLPDFTGSNSLSVKILYFLDYNLVKTRFNAN